MKICTTPAVPEGSQFPLLTRLYTNAGVVAVPGNFSSILLDVYDTEDMKNPLVAARSLSPVSSYVYSSLQTDRDWTINFDSTGYNFAYVTLAADLPVGGKTYQFVFTPNAGAPFAFNVPTLKLVKR